MVRGSFINGLLDGLFKTASAYRRFNLGEQGSPVWVDKRVKVLSDLPENGDRFRRIERALDRLKRRNPRSSGKILRTDHIAIPASIFGDPEQQGFRQSRLHVPLPDENFLSKSWRRGRLHVHRSGPMYVVHKDSVTPQGLGAPFHFLAEGLPAIVSRWRQRGTMPVVSVTDPNIEAQ